MVETAMKMRTALFCLLLLSFCAAAAQNKQPKKNSVTDPELQGCHNLITGLQDKTWGDYSTWEEELQASTRDQLSDCVQNHYLQLPRRDLALALLATNEINASISVATAKSFMAEVTDLKAKLRGAKTVERTSSDGSFSITIMTLPLGFNRQLTVGGNSDRCTADDTASLNCEKFVQNLGWWPDRYFTAMLARSAKWNGTYLIGCQPSPNCHPLVPGDYTAVMSGNDGIVIADLVVEGDPKDSPHHGVYMILSRY